MGEASATPFAVGGIVEEFHRHLPSSDNTSSEYGETRVVAVHRDAAAEPQRALHSRVIGSGERCTPGAESVCHQQHVDGADVALASGQPLEGLRVHACPERVEVAGCQLLGVHRGEEVGVGGELTHHHGVAVGGEHLDEAIGRREPASGRRLEDGGEGVWCASHHLADDTVALMGAPFAITMGDASGVGPEIVLRAHAADELGDDVVVYGDLAILRRGAELLGIEVDWPTLPVVDLGLLTAEQHCPGMLDAASGAAAKAYVERATRDALAGVVSGLVTMPINKEATQLTTPGFVGHTEYIAELCGVQKVSMMLTAATAHGSLAVTHVSTHCSLAEAITRVTTERVLDVVHLTNEVLARFLVRPRIAVCGLNPHAGEHGLFGLEDIEHIEPAVHAARAAGLDVTGPHPADTVFFQAVHRGRYDAIVCMYHDQGHGPMKLLAFDSGVNVTLGLPIVRTSVDHGTAFDIAWTGQAFTDSLRHALAYARRLVGPPASES